MIYLFFFLNNLFLLLMILIGVAFLTLLERKILGVMQFRKGPNKIGFVGLLQPFSDALKLLTKEWFFLDLNSLMFMLSPLIMFVSVVSLWMFYPWFNYYYNLSYSMILLLLILGFNIYPIFSIAWSSSNNYAMLGALRSIAQMISFEVSLFLLIFVLMMMIEGYSLEYLLKYQLKISFCLFMYPLYFMFALSLLIELNRTPFDLVEGESELVSGFNIEYFSSMFVLIFLAEYSAIMFMSLILTLMFYGVEYWSLGFILIYLFHLIFFLWIRGVLPRIRYDELMFMCWNELLMIVLFYVLFIYILKELTMLFYF